MFLKSESIWVNLEKVDFIQQGHQFNSPCISFFRTVTVVHPKREESDGSVMSETKLELVARFVFDSLEERNLFVDEKMQNL